MESIECVTESERLQSTHEHWRAQLEHCHTGDERSHVIGVRPLEAASVNAVPYLVFEQTA